MNAKRPLVIASLLVVALALGCEKRERVEPTRDAAAIGEAADVGTLRTASASAPASDAAVDAGPGPGPASAFVGTVSGRVKLEKGAEIPLAPPLTGSDGKPALSGPPCPPIDLHDRRTIDAHETTGGLSPVHVAITDMRAAPPAEPRVHEVFIDGCRFRPTMLAAQRGDTVRVTNRSDLALLPSLPGDKFMQAMMRGETREFTIKRLGPTRLGCGFSNYCGETSIITLSHPLFAVTDAEGNFTIKNVPLDQPLTLHAWHPLFDVTSVPFTVTAAAPEKRLELELSPAPIAAESPSDAGVARSRGKGASDAGKRRGPTDAGAKPGP
jgi:hypothetical protein